jgi:hypothetical protein
MKKQKIKRLAAFIAVVGMGVGLSDRALADFTITGGPDAQGRQAEADFAIVNGNLQITLKNLDTTIPTAPWDATYILGALFFNYTGSGTLSANSSTSGAVVGSGGGVIGTLADPANTIGSYWAFANGVLTGAPHGATSGLSAVGYSINGMPSNANMGPAPQQQTDGVAGGILGWSDVSGGNNSVKQPLAYTSIVFTLTGSNLPDAAHLTSDLFNDVSFQYGTSLDDANLPEPTTMIAGALLLLPFGASTLKIVRRTKAE